MVPGMLHCNGGVGTESFDAIGTLDRWVDQGVVPQDIIASRFRNGVVDRTLPLLRIALDDSDWQVRRSAMLTLSEVTRAPGCAGSYIRNDEEEAPCLQFWKDWFARRP